MCGGFPFRLWSRLGKLTGLEPVAETGGGGGEGKAELLPAKVDAANWGFRGNIGMLGEGGREGEKKTDSSGVIK